jgi:phosphate transport system substrate-binding protein
MAVHEKVSAKKEIQTMFKKLTTGCGQIAGIKGLAFLAVLVTLACPFTIAAAAEIRVSGAPDDCKGFFDVFKELIRNETGINLQVTPSSSAQALIDLDRGNIDIATTDVTLDKLKTDLENKGYPVDPESFQVQGIGTNTILVYLNKANKVTELSQGQLSDIFTGEITNWKQVGGDNQDIVVVWGDETPDQNRLFYQYVIGSRPIVKTAVWANDQKDIIERIVKTPGAIGIASHAYKSARTHNPKTPFVSATVIAITKGSPSKDTQNLLEVIKSYDF